MSTTHVQSLPNVRGRMSYTEFGEGKRRRAHLENGTDRIAAQMGDAASRGDFIVYCEGQRHRHPNAVNEGYELRISWATDELDPSKADDIQRGMEYAYTLCHELAPDSMCWVTMHVDGEGGCVHAHATIANHDARTGQVINKGDTSLYAPRVKAVNDELSRENGFSVLGADREMSLWEQKRETFQPGSFDRRLGDRVADARDRSSTLDEFRRNLGLRGVTLKETTKTDRKTGEVTTGWSYKAVDEWGPKRRTRKRRASNLADDLTREGIEAYFEAKQRELEAQEQDAPAPEVLPDVPETAEPEEQPATDSALDVYDLDQSGDDTCQWVNPAEHLSYQMPQKPFEIFEEDFRKTAMDYLMFQQGIDAKEFGEKLLDTAMYSSRVSADGESVTVTMQKGGGGDGED